MSKYFTTTLLNWHADNPRNLPWKKCTDVYSIWLSEIIMQQTRVEYGTKYFLKFKQLFPTVKKLAEADLQEVMKAWEGLGYYSRARNLHQTAKLVAGEFDGYFPTTYEGLQKLKGIGPYTAAAIASFAYQIPKAAIDGNAYRLLSRYFGIHSPIDIAKGKKRFQALGDDLIAEAEPACFNQAVMNFGALVCKPKPLCNECPLQTTCYAYKTGKQLLLPIKKSKPSIQKRYFTYFLHCDEHALLIQERTKNDIWKNLHQFYLNENDKQTPWEKVLQQSKWSKQNLPFTIGKTILNQTQQLTHQKIHVNLVVVHWKNLPEIESFKKVNWKDLPNFAFPKVLNVILKKYLT